MINSQNSDFQDIKGKYNFSDFTRDNYRNILMLAKQYYKFCLYDNFEKEDNFIILRHDLDFSVHSAYAVSEIEKNLDISAVYFLHLHNEFYNLLEKEIYDLVLKIISNGHKIGIHFDTHFYNIQTENDLIDKLIFEKDILENIFQTDINVFSFHNTNDKILMFNKHTYGGLINTYSKKFQNDIGYISDSNGYWRYERLEDVIRERKYNKLQILTHPAWWQEKVLSPKKRIWRCIEGRAEKTKLKYNLLLKTYGRENIDD